MNELSKFSKLLKMPSLTKMNEEFMSLRIIKLSFSLETWTFESILVTLKQLNTAQIVGAHNLYSSCLKKISFRLPDKKLNFSKSIQKCQLSSDQHLNTISKVQYLILLKREEFLVGLIVSYGFKRRNTLFLNLMKWKKIFSLIIDQCLDSLKY